MKIEKLEKSHKKKIIFGGVIGLGVIGIITILPSFAKYKLTESINIVNGIINYKVPDLKVMAMYKSDDGVNYTEIEDRMPDSGYIINEEKSYCNLNGEKDTNVVLKTINKNHVISNLIKGDKCYLYFDKCTPSITISDIIAANNPKSETPDFSQVATTDEGVYKVEDGMYSGTSYYWRGAATTNYVKFANFCWRIVRINGDGSIRLIYDGESCHANGTSTKDSIAVTSQTYSVGSGVSEFVGYTYTLGSQRGVTTASNLKTKTDGWYITNIADKGYDAKVIIGKFCNDREISSGSTWSSKPNSTAYYAGYDRSGENTIATATPTLNCSNKEDIYSLKAGAITMDEVIMAGGKWATTNSSYYLYNGQDYWTMSPYALYWYSTYAGVFYVNSAGSFLASRTYATLEIRPVINLRSDITISSGDGTLNNPYIVQ